MGTMQYLCMMLPVMLAFDTSFLGLLYTNRMHISAEDNKSFICAANQESVRESGNRSNLRNQIAAKINKVDTYI